MIANFGKNKQIKQSNINFDFCNYCNFDKLITVI